MNQGMENICTVTVEGIDLNTVTEAELYLRQSWGIRKYVPVICGRDSLLVTIPKEDADRLNIREPVRLQLAYRDVNTHPQLSSIAHVPVQEFLGRGYSE